MKTDDNNLPDPILVIPSPIPKTNKGGSSFRLKCANANTNDDIKIPIISPKSLDKTGSKTPLKIISSNNGAIIVVVVNNKINAK